MPSLRLDSILEILWLLQAVANPSRLLLDSVIRTNLIASAIGLALISLLRFGITQLINQQVEDLRLRYSLRKWLGYSCYGLYSLILLVLWLPDFAGLPTFLGLSAAGLAVVLRDPLVNVVGWQFILWRQPFQMGDRIQMGDHSGDVIDIGVFQISLMEIGEWVEADQSTGRIIHIPNGQIFQKVTANYSKGFKYIWHEIPVLITFESDWETAKKILFTQVNNHAEHLSSGAEEHLRKAGQKYMISYAKLTPTVYTTVKESGILLTMRYLCEPRRRRGSEQVLWENVLREFATHDNISFAYPTQRFFTTDLNGEASAAPPSNKGLS
jgi:small-conductance mechanosensitive channel